FLSKNQPTFDSSKKPGGDFRNDQRRNQGHATHNVSSSNASVKPSPAKNVGNDLTFHNTKRQTNGETTRKSVSRVISQDPHANIVTPEDQLRAVALHIEATGDTDLLSHVHDTDLLMKDFPINCIVPVFINGIR